MMRSYSSPLQCLISYTCRDFYDGCRSYLIASYPEAAAAATAPRVLAPPLPSATSSVASGASSSARPVATPARSRAAADAGALPRRTALKRKREATPAYEHSSERPATKAFQTALQEAKVEEARAQAMGSQPLPKVVSPERVYEDMRAQYYDEYFERKKARAGVEQETVREMRAKARLLFSKLTVPDRVSLARRAAQRPGIEKERAKDLENKAVCLQAMLELRDAASSKYFVRAKGMINTYQSTKHLLFEKPEAAEERE